MSTGMGNTQEKRVKNRYYHFKNSQSSPLNIDNERLDLSNIVKISKPGAPKPGKKLENY